MRLRHELFRTFRAIRPRKFEGHDMVVCILLRAIERYRREHNPACSADGRLWAVAFMYCFGAH